MRLSAAGLAQGSRAATPLLRLQPGAPPLPGVIAASRRCLTVGILDARSEHQSDWPLPPHANIMHVLPSHFPARLLHLARLSSSHASDTVTAEHSAPYCSTPGSLLRQGPSHTITVWLQGPHACSACMFQAHIIYIYIYTLPQRRRARRPDYRKIAAFRKSFPTVPCTALTATATGKVRDDITASLRLEGNPRGHAVFRASFFRDNLTLRVCGKPRDTAKAEAVLVAYLRDVIARHPGGAVIVYCTSRKECDALGARLCDKGLTAAVYHAGLGVKKRRSAQAVWQSGVPMHPRLDL